MDPYSEASSSKKFKTDEAQKSTGARSKHLLYLFIEYAWNEQDGHISAHEDVLLIHWLKSMDINLKNKFWARSKKLADLRKTPRIEFKNHENFNEIHIRNVHKSNRDVKCAQIAYKLRNILSFLSSCNENINYIDERGRTILHIFLEDCLDIDDNSSQDLQNSKTTSLLKQLIAKGAPLFLLDKNGKSPLHIAATCKNQQILEIMTSCFINVNGRDEKGNTALHIVLENCVDEELDEHKNGYVHIIKNLVFKGANVNIKNKQGLTAVHLAAEKFFIQVLEFFAKEDADFSQRTNTNETILHIVFKSPLKLRDSSKMVKTIDFLSCRAGDVEGFDREGCTSLHYAAEFASADIVQRLIDFGASVNCQSKEFLMTPLHIAAKHGRLEIMWKLVKAGANVNAMAADGVTPIFMSAMKGSFENMQYLMDQGADLHRRDKFRGFTLLHLAAYGTEPKQPSVIAGTIIETDENLNDDQGGRKLKALIDEGLDVNDPATCGVTPLQLAVLGLKVSAVVTLIEHGAKVNYQSDKSELTALHLAAIKRQLEIANILIEAGADVNCRGGPEHWTPLHFLVATDVTWTIGRYSDRVRENCLKTSSFVNVQTRDKINTNSTRRFDVITALIKNGADVNAKDVFGRCLLYFATLQRDDFETKALLESGAYVNVQDNKGQLPLHNVLKNDRQELLQNFLDYGADINDRDISVKIMNDKCDLTIIREKVIEHALKLDLLQLHTAHVYKSSIKRQRFTDFYHQCLKEVEKLMLHKVGDSTLYEFLRMKPTRQYFYIEQISSSYESLKKLFPLYFGIIRGTCREATHRKTLIEPAGNALIKIANIYLPDMCVEYILSYVNNRFLEALIVSAKTDRKTAIYTSKMHVMRGWIRFNVKISDDRADNYSMFE